MCKGRHDSQLLVNQDFCTLHLVFKVFLEFPHGYCLALNIYDACIINRHIRVWFWLHWHLYSIPQNHLVLKIWLKVEFLHSLSTYDNIIKCFGCDAYFMNVPSHTVTNEWLVNWGNIMSMWAPSVVMNVPSLLWLMITSHLHSVVWQ